MSAPTQLPPSSAVPEDAARHSEPDPRHGLYRFGLDYGHFMYRVRWLVIAVWAAGLIASVPFAASLGSALKGGGYSFGGSESTRVATALSNTLHQPLSQVIAVFQSAATPVGDPAYRDEVDTFIGQLYNFPHLTNVSVQSPGKDGRTTSVVMSFNTNDSEMQRYVPQMRALLPRVSATSPARAYLTGAPATFADFNTISEQDIQRAESYSLPIALVVLLFVFGSLVAASMPLALALVAVPVALAIIHGIALRYDTTTFVENVATVVGLGISIDYSLFMTRRFRDELAQGRSVREAIGWTVATTGEAILFSGLTVMIGFMGLLLIGLQFMNSFGIGGAVVVGSAVTAALTLLPALLSVLLAPGERAARAAHLATGSAARRRCGGRRGGPRLLARLGHGRDAPAHPDHHWGERFAHRAGLADLQPAGVRVRLVLAAHRGGFHHRAEHSAGAIRGGWQ
jgi:RND superfamily putative drug exporter